MEFEDIVYTRNIEFVTSLVPTICYLVVLMAVGLVGNTIVILVYYKKFKPSITRTYILALGVCDLLNNIFALPSDIVEMRYHYNYYDDGSCKFFGFITRWFALFTAFVLVAIALDRQRTICRPIQNQRQLENLYVELACISVSTMCLAIPFAVLRGLQTTDMEGVANQTAFTCSIDDRYFGTPFFVAYNISMAVAFVICISIMCVAYSLIARHLWLHKKVQLFISKRNTTIRKKRPQQELCQTEKGKRHQENQSSDTSSATVTEVSVHSDPGQEQNMPTAEGENQPAASSQTPDGTCHVLSIQNNPSATATSQTTNGILSRNENENPEMGMCGKDTQGDSKENSGENYASSDVNDVIKTTMPTYETDDEIIVEERREAEAFTLNDSVTDSSSATKVVKPQSEECIAKAESPKPNLASSSSIPANVKIPTRTTLMMFVLTACFVVSYLPYLVMAAVYKGRDLENNNYWLWNLHQISLRSFFINSSVNPLVYSFCSIRFRQQCYRLLCRK